MRQVITVVVVSLLFGLLAACGSDDRLSEEEFLAQGNEICRVGNEELNASAEALFSQLTEESTEEDFQQVIDENGQTFLDDFVSNVRGQIDDIRDLNAPSDLEDDLDLVLDEASEILDRISDADPQEFFESEDDEFAELDTQLLAIGLTTCVE